MASLQPEPEQVDTEAPPALAVRDLTVHFHLGREAIVRAVDGLSFDLWPGERLGIMGESGSGKSVTMLALLGLLRGDSSAWVSGQAIFQERDLLRLPEGELRHIRGSEIALIPQNPMTSFNPVYSIGSQIAEAIRVHRGRRERQGLGAEVAMLLELVGMPEPRETAKRYPHELSGGMRQRAVIAMAIANRPKILIADEPTTALDVTIQAQILDLLQEAARASGAAVILITHDLGVIAEVADRVVVMYAGRAVEIGGVDEIFEQPWHPYTVGLLGSDPRHGFARGELAAIEGQPPSLACVPGGCPFHPRCFLVRDRCTTDRPELLPTDRPGHLSACHYWRDVRAAGRRELRPRTDEEPGRSRGRA